MLDAEIKYDVYFAILIDSNQRQIINELHIFIGDNEPKNKSTRIYHHLRNTKDSVLIKKAVPKEEAEQFKDKMEKLGCVVELRQV